MKLSGKLTASENADDCGFTEEVGDDVVQLLTSTYRKLFPRFNELIEDYNFQERMGRKERKLLPPLCKWVPKEFREGDLELLQGPRNVITVHKKIVVEHSHTGRMITYAPAKEHSKCTQCYVQVFSTESPNRPVFGKIKQCFVHTFAKSTFRFVLLDMYSNIQQDLDTKLWFVPLDNEHNNQAIHEITCKVLSSPLVTARDEGRLWFLNSF